MAVSWARGHQGTRLLRTRVHPRRPDAPVAGHPIREHPPRRRSGQAPGQCHLHRQPPEGAGEEIALSRHGRIVAEVVSAQEMTQLRKERELLWDAALVMVRFATDSGARTDLDKAMEAFDLDRAELEAELAAEDSCL